MTKYSGYSLEPIREGPEFTLYRGRQQGNPSPVLLVAPTAEQPLPRSVRRLEHEYSLAGELDQAWAAKPLALTRDEGRAMLILTDPGGEPFDRVLVRDKERGLDLERTLRLAINLATTLGNVHRRGLIHKDVQPGNILVDDAERVWLTGFGNASLAPRERQTPAEAESGALAYVSPELTGRMNRSIDTRSDLYSLGVILYQMLTGVLPFAAADPLEWIHCHIARQAAAPVDLRAVPESISAITLKLLAKNAEDRYQTAMGLEADLQRCLAEWRSYRRIEQFPLGADDVPDRLLIPEKLYGREREVDVLLSAFGRVTQGPAEFVLVSGYSGVGKSSVVNELHKVLVRSRGLFAAGKFDQYKRDVPYATLAQAFQMLVRQILGMNEGEVALWRRALLEAVGPNGQLMVNLIPEVEFLIGKQPPVAELPSQESRGRFQLVFGRFVGVFARAEHPLALFLDDLQWLDPATLELLERLMADSDVHHLLLIGAYRDNEVSSSHPLMRLLAAIRDAGARMQEIVLAPLALDEVRLMIADALHCGSNFASPLAQLVQEKTGGNPFFAIQFLTSLAEEGLLRFDQSAVGWTWDLERIRAKGYSDNVVDLMVGKLRRLSSETQIALQQLASLGNAAETAILTGVSGQSEEEIHASLLEAARLGLILRLEMSYAFVHDRIQEAAYGLIPTSERAAAHLRIGRTLLSNLTADGLTEHLFDVVNHLNRGAAFLVDPEEKANVAAIDLTAGRRAKASAAYGAAVSYLSAGIALLDEKHWSSHYELTFSLSVERVECELLCGNSEKARQLIVELFPRAQSKIDEAAVYHIKVQLCMMQAEHQQAVETVLTCLRGFGIDMPAHPTEEQLRAECDELRRALDARPIESLFDLPLLTDPTLQAAMRVFSLLMRPAYFTDFNLWCLQACRLVAISLRHGMSGASTAGYSAWGTGVLSRIFHRYGEAYRFAKLACDLAEKHGFTANLPQVYSGLQSTALWTQPTDVPIEVNRKSIRTAIETGDPNAAFFFIATIPCLLLRNDALDAVWRESEVALEFSRRSKAHNVADMIQSQQRFIATMQGRTANFSTFSDAQFDESTFEAQLTKDRMPTFVCSYWVLKLQARFLSRDFGEALEAAEKAKPIVRYLAHIEQISYFYYTALTVSALYDAAPGYQQQAWREILLAHREQLREWAETNPPTFADKYALVSAEVARLEKRDADALSLYEEAIKSARKQCFVQFEGVANELAAQYYMAHGGETAGYAYLRTARACYERWGAHGKVRQLDELYPILRDERSHTASAMVGPVVGQLDVETVAKASQALSSEIVLPELIEKLVRIAVENAGAQRGLLIMVRDGEPRIEAEATTGGGIINVAVRQANITPSDLPESALHYVSRTLEGVLLDDASADPIYSQDEYVLRRRSRSVLCLPIVKQTQLLGALYLENNLTPCAFTADRVTVLQLLSSQAAISLENAALYSDLQRSEAFLAQGQRVSKTGSFGWSLPSGKIHWSEETYNIVEYDRSAPLTFDLLFERVHPGDRGFVQHRLDQAIGEKTDLDLELRLLMPDGRVKHTHIIGRALPTSSGLDFVGAVTDITAAKMAEQKIRQSEKEARQLLDLSPLHITELGPDGARLYTNRASLDYYGINLEQWQHADLQHVLHPQDAELVTNGLAEKYQRGSPFEYEVRLKREDGHYRWFHYRLSPMSDEQGCITRWYAAGTDINDRKLAEERLQDENVALREEIDKASMFEEIVGTSSPLKKVLSRISKVAPTDSSVLITGETGTGKELVARAIHRLSRRSSYSFVSVNCAAIPKDLIASELFGHEKGAFTGAMQRRLGRFELAGKGTIFLDEIGELPAETQVALLRVLQEHEFERIGGTGTIRTEARVIAATNRDLASAMAGGTFRSDLFYRLNVFPIELPPLRKRSEDIPLLVRYFLDRYARKAGRHFDAINRRSLDLLQAYAWPGNIRELQNVIERSVIVNETLTFSVDPSWLSPQPSSSDVDVQPRLLDRARAQEKAIIEDALRDCGGRVSGPSGAAAKLGVPGTTLESKIKALKINKNSFKGTDPSKND